MKTYLAYFDDRGDIYTQPIEARSQNEAVTSARKFGRDHNMKYLYIKRQK